MADEIIAMTMKYRPVPILKVVADTPEFPQGETTENPMPAPNDRSTSVNARDATAPAKTADQDTPGTDGSIKSTCPFCRIACSMKILPAAEIGCPENVSVDGKFHSRNRENLEADGWRRCNPTGSAQLKS